MFRVPRDAANPTFDDTFKVSTGQWLTSSAADRKEWSRRRNAATKVATNNQRAHIDERHAAAARSADAYEARVAMSQAPPASADKETRTLNRLARVSLWSASISLVLYLVGILIVLGVIGFVAWLFVFG